MRSIFNVTKVLFLCLLAIHIKPAHAAPKFIDASADLVRLSIASANAVGDGTTDNSSRIQDAIDYLASNSGGGTLIFKPGTYKVANLHVKSGVQIAGSNRDTTIFRAASTAVMFEVEGGELYNFTAYGTPTAATSGSNWVVGTSGGSATAAHIIRVGAGSTAKAYDVIINSVTAKESRYDVLYTRGSVNLQLINCEFDRASRNIVTMAGQDEGFFFSDCRFGSLWGGAHFNITPSTSSYVRDGVFLNCEFDGSHAGDMGTSTSNKLLWLSGNSDTANNDLKFFNCTFNVINVRLRNTYYGVGFLYNPVMNLFVRVGSDVGQLRDATFRSNDFTLDPIYGSGITFSGSTIFSLNTPSGVNSTPVVP